MKEQKLNIESYWMGQESILLLLSHVQELGDFYLCFDKDDDHHQEFINKNSKADDLDVGLMYPIFRVFRGGTVSVIDAHSKKTSLVVNI
jgi:hypothetical protein